MDLHSFQIFFFKWYAIKLQKGLQVLQTKFLGALCFVNIMSAVNHKKLQTKSHLLEIPNSENF